MLADGGSGGRLVVISLANLHPRMDRNVIVGRLKAAGDYVKRHEPLYTVETRKGVFEVCSEVAGWVVDWLVGDGQVVGPAADLVVVKLDEEAYRTNPPVDSSAADKRGA